MYAKDKSDKIQKYFEELVDFIIKITEIYLYEGKIKDALLIFNSNINVMDLKEVRGKDKAKYLIQYAKTLQQSKFIKEFNYDNEIKILTEAKELAKTSNSKRLMADALDLIGTCIYSIGILEGDYQKAIDFFNQALNIRIDINDNLGVCKSYFNLGLYYQNIKDSNEENNRKSFEFYQKGLKIAIEENFKLEQAYIYRHLAFCYHYYKNDPEKSLQYHLNSAKLREEIGFKISLQFSYFAIAMEYFFLNDFDNSLHYFKEAYTWAKNVNRVEQLKVLIFRDGNEMIKTNSSEKTIKYYELILESAKNVRDLDGINEIEQEIKNLSTKRIVK